MRTTEKRLFDAVRTLKKLGRDKNIKLWSKVSNELAHSRKNRAEVNLWKIDKNSKDGEYVVVPGKVLGDGKVTKKINVVTYKISETGKEKVEKAGGKVYMIDEFAPKNPNQKVKILK